MCFKPAAEELASLNGTLYELNCLNRWSDVIVDEGRYTELGKQAFNCMISYIWAVEATHLGYKIDFTLFPKIAISRGLVKTIQCDIPEINLERIIELGEFSEEDFYAKIQSELSKLASNEFLQHLEVDASSLEAKIYRAATKLATLIELEEIRNGISQREYSKKVQQLSKSFESYSKLPAYDAMTSDDYMNFFRDYSQLRNRIRWAKHPRIIKCGVLGHHFDVACFSYMMSLEKNSKKEDEATLFFFMGIFHDLPEKWTGDMPSPIKDAVKGLRKATEDFENEVMENYVYSHLPKHLVRAVRKVMLEDKTNSARKEFLKLSDNFAAFIECWREVDAGSKHKYYINVLDRQFEDKEKLPNAFRRLVEGLYGELFYR